MYAFCVWSVCVGVFGFGFLCGVVSFCMLLVIEIFLHISVCLMCVRVYSCV